MVILNQENVYIAEILISLMRYVICSTLHDKHVAFKKFKYMRP